MLWKIDTQLTAVMTLKPIIMMAAALRMGIMVVPAMAAAYVIVAKLEPAASGGAGVSVKQLLLFTQKSFRN